MKTSMMSESMTKRNESCGEQEMSIEERIHIIKKEYECYGCLPDDRLASVTNTPELKRFEALYDNGKLRFLKLPSENIKSIFLVIDNEKKKIDIYIHNNGLQRLLNRKQMIIEIKALKKNHWYNLRRRCSDPELLEGKKKGKCFFYNSIRNQEHFSEIKRRLIDIVLFRDGWMRFDITDSGIESIAIKSSAIFSNACDIVVNQKQESGDYYVRGVKNGMAIRNPELVEKLKEQAMVDVLDENQGIYYYYARFVCEPYLENDWIYFDKYKLDGIDNKTMNDLFLNVM